VSGRGAPVAPTVVYNARVIVDDAHAFGEIHLPKQKKTNEGTTMAKKRVKKKAAKSSKKKKR
jgi:hypothetical protein